MRLAGALRHPREPRVLLLRSDRSWRLPRVRVAEDAGTPEVVAAFERRLGTRPWLLRLLPAGGSEEAVELELADESWRPPAHGRWAGRDDLARLPVEPREAVDDYLAELERGQPPPERPPWALPGWRERATAWLEETAAGLGHRLVEVEQVRSWSISAVLRARTDGPELYLKAAARLPLFADEAAVTAALAARYPEHVPVPLAVEPEEGWLLLPAFDELPGWEAPAEVKREVYARFGALQRAAAPAAGELLALGCLDRRVHVLAGQLPDLIADRRALGRLEPKERRAVRGRLPVFLDACGRLAEVGPPPTLVHGDLHLGNVARHGGRLVYFDWTDACVAHPFVDLQALGERDGEAREAYLAAWDGALSPERLREAAAVAAVVRPLHHALSYRTIAASVEPVSRPELDAAHHFLRAALAASHAL